MSEEESRDGDEDEDIRREQRRLHIVGNGNDHCNRQRHGVRFVSMPCGCLVAFVHAFMARRSFHQIGEEAGLVAPLRLNKDIRICKRYITRYLHP